MTARSEAEIPAEKLSETGIKSKASWVWWGMLAACVFVAALSIIFGVRRAEKYGDSPNRGPGLEAAPGAQPARDMDRSANH